MAETTLCSVCGRAPHVIDDPECMPATKPIAEKLAWALEEILRLRMAACAGPAKRAETIDRVMSATPDDAPASWESIYGEFKAGPAFPADWPALKVAFAAGILCAGEPTAAAFEDTKRLDWLDSLSNDALLEFGFELEGGVYLRIDAPGHGATDIREKNSARAAIDTGMIVAPHL